VKGMKQSEEEEWLRPGEVNEAIRGRGVAAAR